MHLTGHQTNAYSPTPLNCATCTSRLNVTVVASTSISSYGLMPPQSNDHRTNNSRPDTLHKVTVEQALAVRLVR